MMAAMHFIQRSMKNKESQKDYISFILQGEVRTHTHTHTHRLSLIPPQKLDGFMRTKAAQEQAQKNGPAAADADRRAARDDAASKSIFQMKSLSKAAFKAQAV